jgi:hypothetical protein
MNAWKQLETNLFFILAENAPGLYMQIGNTFLNTTFIDFVGLKLYVF